MSVIVELALPAHAFELGEILQVERDARVTLETMVPLGGRPVPFVRVKQAQRAAFEKHVREHETVSAIQPVSTHDDEQLYALEWDVSQDVFLRKLLEMDVSLLGASGGADSWQFELRFQSHDGLSEFQEYYLAKNIDVTIQRIYNPTQPDAGPWYGLTTPQRETLLYAVENGYYSLPRGISTKGLATEFDISDQAVTERLRRAIATLVTNTLVAAEED